MTAGRPWWASDGTVDGGLDPSEDPVERFRSARRGSAPGTRPSGEEPDGRSVGDDPGDLPFTDDPGPHADGADGPRTRPRGEGPEGHRDRDLPPAGPWWEAAAETVSRLARDLAETAEAHDPEGTADPGTGTRDDQPGRGTRHGSAAGPYHDPGDGAAHGGPADGSATPGAAREEPHRLDACGICPVCVGLRALGESRPELVGHLAEAARHVALAARSLAARPAPTPSDDEPVQHIDLDE